MTFLHMLTYIRNWLAATRSSEAKDTRLSDRDEIESDLTD